MKKGQKIIGISAIILAISVASIACQKKTETKEVVANETRTTLEYVETIETEETETEKETEETKTEKKETEDKKKETKTTDKKSDSHKKETEGKEISKKESETKPQKPSKPTETQPQKPSKPTETQPQKPSRPTETQPQKPSKPAETQPQKPSKPAETQHSHNWLEVTKQVYHEAEGHYKTEVIQEAWDEPIYESHNFCNVCLNLDLGSADNAIIHSVETGHGYHSERVQVGTQHHDAVTEKKWVEDKAAWTETVVVGYKCSSCGETKKK